MRYSPLYIIYLCGMLKKLFHWYIHGSIHVALAVYALVRVTEVQLMLPYHEAVAYVAFYGTIVSYNFIKYRPTSFINLSTYIKEYLNISILTSIVFMFAVYYALQLPYSVLILLTFVAVLTFLYALPILPNHKSLRYTSGAKVSAVALCWTLVTVFAPVLAYESSFTTESIWIGIERFFFVFALTIPFEIRDLKTDDHSLSTLPKRWGILRAKQVGYILLSLSIGIDFFFCHRETISISMFVITTGIVGIIGLGIRGANTEQHQYYSAFFIEAIPILWWTIVSVWQ